MCELKIKNELLNIVTQLLASKLKQNMWQIHKLHYQIFNKQTRGE